MIVLMINSSTHEKGCTYTALSEVARALQEEGIDSEIVWLGTKPVSDCLNCGYCKKEGRCVCGDVVDDVIEKAKQADGYVFGTPVYYAHPSGRLLSFMDRLWITAGKYLAYKPAAAVASARRNGQVCTMDVINKHFSINQMPIVTSSYWNHVFGSDAEDVAQDKEGLQTMYNLGKNMAWMLKLIENGRKNGITHPDNVTNVRTNFAR